LACGGCQQQCGRIPKDKLFFIDEQELKWVIDWILAHTNHSWIGILGGEPTIHPEYNAFLDLFRTYKGRACFCIYTNNRLKHIKPYSPDQMFHNGDIDDNLYYWVSPKDKPARSFVPTLVAPIDFYGEQDDKTWYWQLAKKNCHCWHKCPAVIIHKRAYICEVVGPIDTLTGEDNGWELKWGERTLDKSEQEISEQAAHFCHRCAFCLPNNIRNNFPQRISDPSFVTISNANLLNKDVIVVATKTEL
jgi:hypothetical protein